VWFWSEVPAGLTVPTPPMVGCFAADHYQLPVPWFRCAQHKPPAIIPHQHRRPLHEVGSSLVKSRCGHASRGCQQLLTARWCGHRDSEAPLMEDTPPEQSSGAR
jgi:hypothetical protein